jgi:2,3-bisphosphoglycerate-dependent phosphoglycerate mutase
MNRIFVIRHGETHWNREGRFQGSLDIPLNETGRAQAEATAQYVAAIAPKAEMFSSQLMRARDTAGAIAAALNTDLHFDISWRERGYGVQEGATYKEWQARDPAGYALYKTNDPDYTPQGGETGRMFYERSVNAFESLAARAGDVGCVVTHGGVISALYRWANALPLASPRAWEVPNCGINEFVREGAAWRLVRFADISHLKDMLDDVTV